MLDIAGGVILGIFGVWFIIKIGPWILWIISEMFWAFVRAVAEDPKKPLPPPSSPPAP